ncbi:sensor domain-containing diguanylate cyclase [Cohnella sp. CFH 77786]|uniref:sensor domain-containing diguanylate cyclase n=1 Tax=Cohnella sp. CFH 77786 TaxID=2662265 RepID=UPI001C60E7EB|nr:sensor domain-containing diguanylate cyclase [Cohnella sp. CFH 77786]
MADQGQTSRSPGTFDTPMPRSLQLLPPWLRNQDFTEADLPYLHELLQGSFVDWFEKADGFPWLAGLFMVYHADGSCVAMRSGLEDGGFLPRSGVADHPVPSAVRTALDTCRPALSRADERESIFLRTWDALAVPVFARTTGMACAVLACLLPGGSAQAGDLKLLQAAALHYRNCLYRRFEQMFASGLLREQKLVHKEEKRRDTLFEVLRRLNDHSEVEQILSELLASLDKLYPNCKIDLFLSQDYSSMNERVKPLAFHENEMDLCRQAFLDGVVRDQRLNGFRRLAVPLSGKQGVYGVLRLDIPQSDLDEPDLRFLTTLAGSAGAAFEKAKLHEQANVLVGELRLINDLSQRLNSSLKLSDTFQFASSELLRIFRADFCCILQVNPDKSEFVAMTSNVPEMIGESFAIDYGFVGVMWNSKEPIILSDYSQAAPVPSKMMGVTDSRSLLAAPLVLNGDVIGAVMISHREPNHFSYDNYKLLQVLSAHLGLAVSNATLHAEVRRMVITDNLTGLFARHYLNERILRRQKRDASGSLILCDIDHFKRVNDTFGHQVGDEILRQVSQIIRSSIRDGDIAARWGGEELAIYLPEVGYDITGKVAERIRRRVENETHPQVTISCGMSEWRSTDERISVESLFYRADMALYEAKHLGRNRVEIG